MLTKWIEKSDKKLGKSKDDKIKKLSITPIEKIEGIDDLRLIENGIKIRITFTKEITETVDTPEDLTKVISMMNNDKLISQYSFGR